MANIRDEFQINGVDTSKSQPILESFSSLLDTVEQHVPTSRARSLVVTKLQEACYWSIVGCSDATKTTR
jgi:hypothetical protein